MIVEYVGEINCGIFTFATPLASAKAQAENCRPMSRCPAISGYVGVAYPSPLLTVIQTLAFGIGFPDGSKTVTFWATGVGTTIFCVKSPYKIVVLRVPE